VYLHADAEFLTKMEDGNSLGKTLEEKKKQLEIFDRAIEFSKLQNKLKIKVDKDGSFIPKEEMISIRS
jgi:hypothetical protein